MNATRRGWALYVAAWLPPTLLYALAVMAQGQATFMQSLLSGAVIMGVAAIEGVGVWWLSGRIPVGRSPFVFFPLHLALAGTYAAVLVGAESAWLWLVAGRDVAAVVWRLAGPWQLISSAWMYAMIAGVSYLIRTQRRLREREVAGARAEAAAAQLQLRALRAQLNPHFLFNSLHSLSTLVRHDAERAELAVDQLGELLRYALDHGAQESVRLHDELAFVRNYLELEKLRFGDRLRIQFDVDDAAGATLVPPFLLQPLVENAIRHGLAPRSHGGTLWIAACSRDGQLTLDVRDNGNGSVQDDVAGAKGLGLRLLRQQLESRFGGRAALHFQTSPGQGFHVAIALPARTRSREVVT